MSAHSKSQAMTERGLRRATPAQKNGTEFFKTGRPGGIGHPSGRGVFMRYTGVGLTHQPRRAASDETAAALGFHQLLPPRPSLTSPPLSADNSLVEPGVASQRCRLPSALREPAIGRPPEDSTVWVTLQQQHAVASLSPGQRAASIQLVAGRPIWDGHIQSNCRNISYADDRTTFVLAPGVSLRVILRSITAACLHVRNNMALPAPRQQLAHGGCLQEDAQHSPIPHRLERRGTGRLGWLPAAQRFPARRSIESKLLKRC